jgi:hypothetical protein
MRASTPIKRHAQVVDHHFGPFLGQELTDFSANAIPATSDRRYFPFQNHRCSSYD